MSGMLVEGDGRGESPLGREERASKDRTGVTLELGMRGSEFSKPAVGGLGPGFRQNLGHDRE